ncbi:MAG: copper transporter [Bacillota bacterium]
MYLNLKYHIASLVAVFLAMGLGILIGSALPGDDVLAVHQQQLAGKLEAKMYTLSQKNNSLQSKVNLLETENNIKSQFENQVLPALVFQKLKGRSISIIATSGNDMTEGLLKTLTLAGAEVKSINLLNFSAVRDEDELLKILNWPSEDKTKIIEKLSHEVSKSIVEGHTENIKKLEDENIVKVNGYYGVYLSDVILLGGSHEKGNQKARKIDSSIAKYFKERGINVYGIEESGVFYSYMNEYQKMGLTTVDNIDTIAGQVALVYAISGKPGHYGIKPTAKRLLPVMDYGVEVIVR